jgi:hypothetical protein
MLLQVACFAWAMHQMQVGAWSGPEMVLALRAAAVVHSVLNTVSYALLLVAVFGWRGGGRPGPGREGGPAEEGESED